MVIFSIKLFNNVRKAIAGRRFPHQLAGGVALGVLLGIIPHGNLLALIVLVSVLCFRVNHALMAVVAIAASFGATRLDSYSHQVGEFLLTHPTGNHWATQAWSLPLVPWTDINNTVVLGSFVIGLASVLPVFAITLPLFRLTAPEAENQDGAAAQDSMTPRSKDIPAESKADSRKSRRIVATVDTTKNAINNATADRAPDRPAGTPHSVSLMVDQQENVPPPRFAVPGKDITEPSSAAKPESITEHNSNSPVTIPIDSVLTTQTQFLAVESTTAGADYGVDHNRGGADRLPTNEQMVSVETRIDVIRMKDFSDDDAVSNASGTNVAKGETEQPMDEALNYLLHQLRHSQERKAAG